MPVTPTISLRIDPELLERVDASADQERRTRSNMIEKLLQEALDVRGSAGRKK